MRCYQGCPEIQDNAFPQDMAVKTLGNSNAKVSHLPMDIRRRRENEITKEKGDSEDKGETVRTKRVAVDLVDVQVMSTFEQDDEGHVVVIPEMVAEPMDLPDMTSLEYISDSEQE